MPLAPRYRHPLRDLRTVLDKTQVEFSELVGTSAITIKRIENGSLDLSDKLAARIMAATGAMPAELQKGRKGQALDLLGEPYTTETFQSWNQRWNHATPKRAIEYAQTLSKFIEILCEAAVSDQTPNLRSVYSALAAAIDDVCRDYGLDRSVTKLHQKKGFTRGKLPDRPDITHVDSALGSLIDNAYRRLGKRNPATFTTH